MPDNALVDEMKLSVGARADIAARIEDLVARPKERSLWARLDDDARRIVADHFCGAGRGRGAGAHLRFDCSDAPISATCHSRSHISSAPNSLLRLNAIMRQDATLPGSGVATHRIITALCPVDHDRKIGPMARLI